MFNILIRATTDSSDVIAREVLSDNIYNAMEIGGKNTHKMYTKTGTIRKILKF